MADQKVKVWEDALFYIMQMFPRCVYNYSREKEVDFLKMSVIRKDIEIFLMFGNGLMLSAFAVTNGATVLSGCPGQDEAHYEWFIPGCFMNTSDIAIFDRNQKEWGEMFLDTARDGITFGEFLSDEIYICDGQSFHPLKKSDSYIT